MTHSVPIRSSAHSPVSKIKQLSRDFYRWEVKSKIWDEVNLRSRSAFGLLEDGCQRAVSKLWRSNLQRDLKFNNWLTRPRSWDEFTGRWFLLDCYRHEDAFIHAVEACPEDLCRSDSVHWCVSRSSFATTEVSNPAFALVLTGLISAAMIIVAPFKELKWFEMSVSEVYLVLSRRGRPSVCHVMIHTGTLIGAVNSSLEAYVCCFSCLSLVLFWKRK